MTEQSKISTVQAPSAPATAPRQPSRMVQMLYPMLMALIGLGLFIAVWQALAMIRPRDLPSPLATVGALVEMLSNPFYDNGPNDKGIGIQTWMSLSRVFAGWIIGSLIAIPIGTAMGASRTVMAMMNPIVQLLRPISPLAWFPIGLALLKSSPNAAIFVIIITSLWPTMINTMFGVSSLPSDYRNVARVFNFSPAQYVTKVLLPYALPHILTGMRLSMGIAWLVIVAAEMLAGGTGIGYFIWDTYNSAGLAARIIAAIVIIGVIGLLLDRGLDWVTKKVGYAS